MFSSRGNGRPVPAQVQTVEQAGCFGAREMARNGFGQPNIQRLFKVATICNGVAHGLRHGGFVCPDAAPQIPSRFVRRGEKRCIPRQIRNDIANLRFCPVRGRVNRRRPRRQGQPLQAIEGQVEISLTRPTLAQSPFDHVENG